MYTDFHFAFFPLSPATAQYFGSLQYSNTTSLQSRSAAAAQLVKEEGTKEPPPRGTWEGSERHVGAVQLLFVPDRGAARDLRLHLHQDPVSV
uniref:Uncharacterized protein n=1 Tax=Leersia perrieri TaxID=77586 RepID=A0A0D9WDX8_9ORYZ